LTFVIETMAYDCTTYKIDVFLTTTMAKVLSKD